MYSKIVPALLVIIMMMTNIGPSEEGLFGAIASYGGCQTACNAAWVACCASAGVVAGKYHQINFAYFKCCN